MLIDKISYIKMNRLFDLYNIKNFIDIDEILKYIFEYFWYVKVIECLWNFNKIVGIVDKIYVYIIGDVWCKVYIIVRFFKFRIVEELGMYICIC